MNLFNLAHTILTVALSIIFIGIVLWAYSGSRRQRFADAARLVLEDDVDVNASDRGGRSDG